MTPSTKILAAVALTRRPADCSARPDEALDLADSLFRLDLQGNERLDRELPSPVESPVSLEDFVVGPGLDDRGDAGPVGQGQSVAQALDVICRSGLGDMAADEPLRRLAERS